MNKSGIISQKAGIRNPLMSVLLMQDDANACTHNWEFTLSRHRDVVEKKSSIVFWSAFQIFTFIIFNLLQNFLMQLLFKWKYTILMNMFFKAVAACWWIGLKMLNIARFGTIKTADKSYGSDGFIIFTISNSVPTGRSFLKTVDAWISYGFCTCLNRSEYIIIF